jgi:hypothetical protein
VKQITAGILDVMPQQQWLAAFADLEMDVPLTRPLSDIWRGTRQSPMVTLTGTPLGNRERARL